MENSSHDAELLSSLGLSQYEAKSYIALIALGTGNGYTVAKEAGIPTSKVYQALASLESKGFAKCSGLHQNTYIPVNASKVIDTARKEIDRKFTGIESLLASIKPKASALNIVSLNNQDDIAARAYELTNSAEKKVLISGWPNEINTLKELIEKKRKTKFFVLSYGDFECNNCEIFFHRNIEQVKGEFGARWLLIAVDGVRSMAVFFGDKAIQGIEIDNPELTELVADHIRHDISINSLMQELPPKMRITIDSGLDVLRNKLYFK
ncbi:MAG: TrmB family transcriptional regulator [Fibrobacteres bacterium]|nr:TrmB family transcriptional regulator [Fibrobacterota bacterium]